MNPMALFRFYRASLEVVAHESNEGQSVGQPFDQGWKTEPGSCFLGSALRDSMTEFEINFTANQSSLQTGTYSIQETTDARPR
jgi:hypothetical protein